MPCPRVFVCVCFLVRARLRVQELGFRVSGLGILGACSFVYYLCICFLCMPTRRAEG